MSKIRLLNTILFFSWYFFLSLASAPARAESQQAALDRMIRFMDGGVPECTDVAAEFSTQAFAEKFRKLLKRETGGAFDRSEVTPSNLRISDCATFYTVTAGRRKYEMGLSFIFFFTKSLVGDNGFPNGDFLNYGFITM